MLNLGGIANLTLLGADGRVIGFDCGPGQRAARPVVPAPPRRALRRRRRLGRQRPGHRHPCWQRCWPSRTSTGAPPKSTGRDLFNLAGSTTTCCAMRHAAPHRRRAGHAGRTDGRQRGARPARAMRATTRSLLVCGGGALNAHLMRAWRQRLPGVPCDARPPRTACRPIRSKARRSRGWHSASSSAAGQPAGGHRRPRARACSARSTRPEQPQKRPPCRRP